MEVLVDGSRASADFWLESQTMPAATVPSISLEEHRVAQALSLTDDEYARSKYAIEKTRTQLQMRAERLGDIVKSLLDMSEVPGEVSQVWLSTFRGEYRVDLRSATSEVCVEFPEDVADAILDNGSKVAEAKLKRLLVSRLTARSAA